MNKILVKTLKMMLNETVRLLTSKRCLLEKSTGRLFAQVAPKIECHSFLPFYFHRQDMYHLIYFKSFLFRIFKQTDCNKFYQKWPCSKLDRRDSRINRNTGIVTFNESCAHHKCLCEQNLKLENRIYGLSRYWNKRI